MKSIRKMIGLVIILVALGLVLASCGKKEVAVEQVTINYNSDGGTSIASQKVNKGTHFVYPKPEPTKEGYDFAFWKDEDGSKFSEGSVVNNSITLKAVWVLKEYTVKFMVDGRVFHSVKVEHNDSIFTPTPPQFDGKNFIEWRVGEEVFDDSVEITKNLIVNAYYELINYTIQYDLPDGYNFDNPNPESYTVEDEIELQSLQPIPLGYEFKWFRNVMGGTEEEITKIEKGTIGDLVIIGRIIPIEYTISYEDLLDHEHSNPLVYTIETDDINLADPDKIEGYDFIGWYTEKEGGYKITVIEKGNTGNKVLYARFSLTVYSITYMVDKPVSHSNPTSYTIESETILLEDAKLEGFDFVGWFLDAELTKPIEEIEKGTTGNLIIFAKFTPENVIDPPVDP